ncbi:hypothetical protein SNE25_23055 [Mucilaginibacter sabulilitoris]|uniref:Sugar 3,4-ketoisomerase QdtA cupin domain-containing protein n=1 Tax=Mucilaginibacter sabulilitoris TaxID=1173583 RepID=A0ABZ0TG96_9SPHI|nr:hypothetical protein [Mucilaginibacter sabulilitoris]WPU92204.1 hypothetical protein SNE25_23055 [Mucilaginibacter sabulilitoris]
MLIETYIYKGEGYDPFLIRDNWQVAKLNYMPGQGFTDIVKIDKHTQTDEVFILLKGTAVLIAAERNGNAYSFYCLKMQPGITYNIKANTWHNIAMDTDAELIIVENSNTHVHDCIYVPLNDNEKIDLFDIIQSALK